MAYKPVTHFDLPVIEPYNRNELSITEMRKEAIEIGKRIAIEDLVEELSKIRPKPVWVKETLKWLKKKP